MNPKCPNCASSPDSASDGGRVVRHASFFRASDRKYVRRYRCRVCKTTFSDATFDPFYRCKARPKVQLVYEHSASTNSIRRTARTLRAGRETIVRYRRILAILSEARMDAENRARPPVTDCQFDDLETHEHTLKKPLSVFIVVNPERYVLTLEVAGMPARGRLAKASVEKYGPRKDERKERRIEALKRLLPVLAPNVEFKSDKNPHYPPDVRAIFPDAKHTRYKGRKPRKDGQGELKRGGYDPLYALNHTCGQFRADVNRVLRKTWCTTKKADRLRQHLFIAADYKNQFLATERPPVAPRDALSRQEVLAREKAAATPTGAS